MKEEYKVGKYVVQFYYLQSSGRIFIIAARFDWNGLCK